MADRREKVLANPETEYEREDLKLAVIAGLALILVVFLGLTPLVLRGAYPTAADDVNRKLLVVPPAPELQTDPQEDLRMFRSEEVARLNSYGWVDRAHGIVHIPIEEAMRQAVEKGIDGFPRSGQ